jgi:TetR/AcrR family transcriptional regulator
MINQGSTPKTAAASVSAAGPASSAASWKRRNRFLRRLGSTAQPPPRSPGAQVLTGIVNTWLNTADEITPEAEPARALTHYIAAKIELARERPIPSRVFANEIIHGAPHLGKYLETDLRSWLDTKAKVIRGWIAAGKMREVDPRHLFFMIWASTQTYADFASQISAVMGRELTEQDYKTVARQMTDIVLRGCGLTPPSK